MLTSCTKLEDYGNGRHLPTAVTGVSRKDLGEPARRVPTWFKRVTSLNVLQDTKPGFNQDKQLFSPLFTV
ncbi:MAG: hypothetical protein WCH99_10530 [Verrucomicrobiota bacterium]